MPARGAGNIQNVTTIFCDQQACEITLKVAHFRIYLLKEYLLFIFTGDTHILFSEIVTATTRRNISRKLDERAACHSSEMADFLFFYMQREREKILFIIVFIYQQVMETGDMKQPSTLFV